MTSVHAPVASFDQDGPSSTVTTRAKPEPFVLAERRMRTGKRLVIGGFFVSVAGIIGYCLACFAAGQNVASSGMADPAWFVAAALGVVGLGTLLWLLGSFLFLSGAMDGDPEGPDLYF